MAVCFCQSAYVWTASENPSFHIFLTSELRVGGKGCVSQESNIHTHSSQWLARCVEVRRWEGTAAVNWLFTLLLSAAAQPSLLEITFILRSFVVMTLDVTCSNPAGDLSCHLSPLSLCDNGIKWPKNNSIIIFKKNKLQLYNIKLSFSNYVTMGNIIAFFFLFFSRVKKQHFWTGMVIILSPTCGSVYAGKAALPCKKLAFRDTWMFFLRVGWKDWYHAHM